MRLTKRFSTTFRRAHDILAAGEEEYSCDAIRAVKDYGGALLWWRDHFTPSQDSPEHYWLRHTGMTDAEKHEWRLTGLLLAAAITKSEGI
jgi:hypothetical protein